MLLEARELCLYGTWLPWLAEHFEGSERSARAYMQVAREWGRLTEANRQRVADLPYREALRALVASRIDDVDRLYVDNQLVADQVDLASAPRRQVQELVRAGKDAQAELARRRAEVTRERRLLSIARLPSAASVRPTFRVYRGDNREVLPSLPADSVQLVITSPGYGVGWDYADGGAADSLPIDQHLEQLREVLTALLRVLRCGGVLALNLPETIRTPDERAYPLVSWATLQLRELGYLLREPIVWQHQDAQGRPLAFGTAIGAPTNPYIRRTREHVLLASVGDYRIPGKGAQWPPESIEWLKDTWTIGPGRAQPGDPLAFPDELVRRLIELFSAPDDVVLDPYAGTGAVGRVARELGRAAWLIEREASYWPDLEALAAA